MNRGIIITVVALVVLLVILLNAVLQERGVQSELDSAFLLLGGTRPEDVAEAKEILDKHPARALPLLLRAASSEEEVRRANALNVLGSFEAHLAGEERQKAIDAIVTRLKDVSPSVRVAAVLTLSADFRHAAAAGELERIVTDDKDINVRMAALGGVGRIAGEKEVLFIAKALEDRDDRIVMAACAALGYAGRADALRLLLAELRRPRGLAVRREQLIAVAALGEVLKGGEPDKEVLAALDEAFREARPDTMLIQANQDQSGGIPSPPQRVYLLEILNTYYRWGGGERIKLFFDRIRAASGEERETLRGAVSDFIENMTTAGIIRGKDIKVVVEMGEADTKLMFFVCGELMGLIETDGNFAVENLHRITGLNFGGDVVKWRRQYEKWTTGTEKFKVAPPG